MIPWWELIPAVMAGTMIGFWIAALLAANDGGQEKDE